MRELRHEAIELLSRYTGFPDLPNGRPCGVWAYMVANDTVPATFARYADGTVRRLDPSTSSLAVETYVLDIPRFDPCSERPPSLYYAAIETNPAGIMIATLPKGAQDVVARKDGVRRVVELGQRRQLLELVREFGVDADIRGLDRILDVRTRRERELYRLHVLAIETLLAHGYDVHVEGTFDAAVRETKEEHGFDLERERPKVGQIDAFVELALSKRRSHEPIHHYVYAVLVSDFDETLPRVSQIVEAKDPGREGEIYVERGLFVTLRQMWQRAKEACDTIQRSAGSVDMLVQRELNATRSRLGMLARIEGGLVRSLRQQGVVVHSDSDPRHSAAALHTDIYRAPGRSLAS